MNNALLASYTTEDVHKALFDTGDLKPPGLDRLHAIFYKRFWPMLGDDLIEDVLQAINTCTSPSGWNDIAIVMIPKVNTPEKATQFRSINLCNVAYKIIAKIGASRLKVFHLILLAQLRLPSCLVD